MFIKGLIDEDFINYKKPCMVIEFPYCSFKCDKENGSPVCQNDTLVNDPDIEIKITNLVERYIKNDISKSIVMQGLEPFDSWNDLLELIREFRKNTDDDIVIYTGYRENEIKEKISKLSGFCNIIIKFGRYIPNCPSHYDDILGINLSSKNQYAKIIS